jgi:hypothetical protein
MGLLLIGRDNGPRYPTGGARIAIEMEKPKGQKKSQIARRVSTHPLNALRAMML